MLFLAFIQSEFVDRYGAILSKKLLDTAAIGQFTPGLVFRTVSFVGYLIQWIPGAIVGTLGILLPYLIIDLFLYSEK